MICEDNPFHLHFVYHLLYNSKLDFQRRWALPFLKKWLAAKHYQIENVTPVREKSTEYTEQLLNLLSQLLPVQELLNQGQIRSYVTIAKPMIRKLKMEKRQQNQANVML